MSINFGAPDLFLGSKKIELEVRWEHFCDWALSVDHRIFFYRLYDQSFYTALDLFSGLATKIDIQTECSVSLQMYPIGHKTVLFTKTISFYEQRIALFELDFKKKVLEESSDWTQILDYFKVVDINFAINGQIYFVGKKSDHFDTIQVFNLDLDIIKNRPIFTKQVEITPDELLRFIGGTLYENCLYGFKRISKPGIKNIYSLHCIFLQIYKLDLTKGIVETIRCPNTVECLKFPKNVRENSWFYCLDGQWIGYRFYLNLQAVLFTFDLRSTWWTELNIKPSILNAAPFKMVVSHKNEAINLISLSKCKWKDGKDVKFGEFDKDGTMIVELHRNVWKQPDTLETLTKLTFNHFYTQKLSPSTNRKLEEYLGFSL